MSDWRDPLDGVDWSDGGPVEVELSDGSTAVGRLTIDEAWDGEDEWPIPMLDLREFPQVGFYDVKRWRPRA